jgi:hypothetical protein
VRVCLRVHVTTGVLLKRSSNTPGMILVEEIVPGFACGKAHFSKTHKAVYVVQVETLMPEICAQFLTGVLSTSCGNVVERSNHRERESERGGVWDVCVCVSVRWWWGGKLAGLN